MTREEFRDYVDFLRSQDEISYDVYSGLIDGIDTLEQDPCDDAISRQYLLDNCVVDKVTMPYVPVNKIKEAPPVNPQEPKTGHCKDCKWWKDSDGMFRRGCNAESQCPMNRIEVYEGTGYCFMFEPQESEE